MEPFKLTPDPDLFQELCDLIETLRGPDGCPWDRKQTPQSIIGCLIEEGYELADAVAAVEPEAVLEELGDVLFLLLFLVQLYRENNEFGLNAVLGGVHAKMVRRHPHVFADLAIEDADEVSRNWARIKKSEKLSGQGTSLLDRIPHATPALIRAHRISEVLADSGLDSRTAEDIWHQIDSAMTACRQQLLQGAAPRARSSYGDLLWTLVALGRKFGIQPEKALSDSLDRFEGRFQELEQDLGAVRLKAGAAGSEKSEIKARLFE